jgi:pimeloyl-ACP methyl ester carboxylesterase
MGLYRLLKAPFFGKYRKPWTFPASENRAHWQPLAIDSRSKARLAALFGAARTAPAFGNVLLAHPMGSEAKGFFLRDGHARFLRDHGFNVLVFDFNGFGESEEGSFAYVDDLLAAGEALRRRAPGLPTALFGTSFGGAWAICALSRPGHGFDVAVVEAAFTSLAEYWGRFPLANAVLRVVSALRPGLERALRPIAQIRSLREVRRLLLVYGDEDRWTPVSMGERLLKACNLPETDRALWRLPGAKHTQGFLTASQACRERYLRFLRESLSAAVPGPERSRS